MGVTPISTWDRAAGSDRTDRDHKLVSFIYLNRTRNQPTYSWGETKSFYGEVPAKNIPEAS